MRSKNSKTITAAEHEHLAKVKACNCVICGMPGPSEAHHVNQGDHFTTIALCKACHTGPYGIHGNKQAWRFWHMDEWSALNETLRRINGGGEKYRKPKCAATPSKIIPRQAA